MRLYSKEKRPIFEIETERLFLRVLPASFDVEVADYLRRNRDFHKPFQQLHDDAYYSAEVQRQYLKYDLRAFRLNEQFGFWIFLKSVPTRVVGRLSFVSVIRGAMQSCFMGYHLDQNCVGFGYMTEAIKAGCQYMFKYQQLHRIQADVMPHNARSNSTILRSGFIRQGLNKDYMAIDGRWEDHQTYALINADYQNDSILNE